MYSGKEEKIPNREVVYLSELSRNKSTQANKFSVNEGKFNKLCFFDYFALCMKTNSEPSEDLMLRKYKVISYFCFANQFIHTQIRRPLNYLTVTYKTVKEIRSCSPIYQNINGSHHSHLDIPIQIHVVDDCVSQGWLTLQGLKEAAQICQKSILQSTSIISQLCCRDERAAGKSQFSSMLPVVKRLARTSHQAFVIAKSTLQPAGSTATLPSFFAVFAPSAQHQLCLRFQKQFRDIL